MDSKDFKSWHSKKSQIDQIQKRPFFHEREVWFCSLGVNVGFESDGKGAAFLRPVLIIKKFGENVLWGISLTKKIKRGKYYHQFRINKSKFLSTAVLSQIRLIDAKRLYHKIGEASNSDFA